MSRVMVIGSNSFSGSDFIDLLLEQGKYEVLGLSRSPEKPVFMLPYKRHPKPPFRFEQADLNQDMEKIRQLLNDWQPEYVVNFAAQSEVGPSWKNPTHWFQTNAVAITALAQALCDQSSLKRYVHISSPEVYGTCHGKVKESAGLNPSTPYAASKAAGDLSLFTFHKNFNLPLSMVRATNVYGPHQQLFKIIPRTCIYLKMGKRIPLHGGGVAVKSYIHIRDVSRGELEVMERGSSGEIYHLSPEGGYAVRDIVEELCQLSGLDFDSCTEVVGERLGQDAAYLVDSSKAREQFAWAPQIPLRAGLQDVLNWVDKHWTEIQNASLDYTQKE